MLITRRRSVTTRAERRIEFKVHVDPVIGRNEARMMAGSLFDFLLQYLERDDLDNDDDLE
jgi:hypothetical protein